MVVGPGPWFGSEYLRDLNLSASEFCVSWLNQQHEPWKQLVVAWKKLLLLTKVWWRFSAFFLKCSRIGTEDFWLWELKTASYASVALHFVCFLFFFIIFILQFLYHDQCRTEIRTALSDIVLIHQQLHHEFISDRARLSAMSTYGKLVLDPFPTEPLEFGI
jgi:hypothetical protein